MCSASQDHPRSRGVYAGAGFGFMVGAGSSPLARGLLTASDELVRAGRIIPARAGFTLRSLRGHDTGSDHPRSRGVYLLRRMSSFERDGSSPLARGLRRMSK